MSPDELPPLLRARLASFPTAAIRDDIDRAAAAAVEMALVRVSLKREGLAAAHEDEVIRGYLRALYATFERAGKWSPPVGGVRVVDVTWARPRQMILGASRVRHVTGSVASWITNRRVAARRRRWQNLLAGR